MDIIGGKSISKQTKILFVFVALIILSISAVNASDINNTNGNLSTENINSASIDLIHNSNENSLDLSQDQQQVTSPKSNDKELNPAITTANNNSIYSINTNNAIVRENETKINESNRIQINNSNINEIQNKNENISNIQISLDNVSNSIEDSLFSIEEKNSSELNEILSNLNSNSDYELNEILNNVTISDLDHYDSNTTEYPASGVTVATFTKNQILTAANAVKNYVDKNSCLPNYVTINNKKLGMNNFLYLLAKEIVNINKGLSSPISYEEIKNPSNPQGSSVISGFIYKTEYVNLATKIINYINSDGQAPNYGTTSLGNIQYQSIIEGFSRALNFVKTNNYLPNYINYDIKSTSQLNTKIPIYSDNENDNSNSIVTSGISLSQIKDAATRVKNYVETNKVLPKYVTIAGSDYTMAKYLYLVTTAIANINNEISSNIIAITAKEPSNPSTNTISGNLYKSNYIELANKVSNYIKQNEQAPNYGSTSLGNVNYNLLVYGFSKVLNFQSSNNYLPNYLSLASSIFKTSTNTESTNSGSSNIPSSVLNDKNTLNSLSNYLKASTNCQVDNAKIQSLAKSLTKSCSSDWAKAKSIFNWVNSNINYDGYSNTKYGAVGVLSAEKANCVDTAHLIIALSRASGLAARYVHGVCNFTSSKDIGHVWAQILIGNTWVVADGTSSRNSLGSVKNWDNYNYKLLGKYYTISF